MVRPSFTVRGGPNSSGQSNQFSDRLTRFFESLGRKNEPPIDIHTYKAILAVIRSSKPGRYAIAEIEDAAQAPPDN